MTDYLGKDIFKLGFGLMRLPKKEDGTIDIDHTSKMVDAFIAAGGQYFDTAYVYENGESERAFKLAVADRYPRERYLVCTKMNAWLRKEDEASTKQQFFTSLERTGAGYFDFYLLHSLQRNNYKLYDEFGLWDFLKEQKDKGLIPMHLSLPGPSVMPLPSTGSLRFFPACQTLNRWRTISPT